MNFADRFFDPQELTSGGGLPARLQSLLQEQAGYQPQTAFGGWPQTAAAPGQGIQPPLGPQPMAPQAMLEGVGQPAPYPMPSVPIPAPRPADMPSGGIAIGDYMMPQYGRPQTLQDAQAQPDLADRLSAGFRSWAYTPVGNPFAALANAITGFSSGQFTTAPQVKTPDVQPGFLAPSQEGVAAMPSAGPVTRMQPVVRMPGGRFPYRR